MSDLPFPPGEYSADFRAFWAELNKELTRESDRAVVLITAARLDILLARSIDAFVVNHPDTKRLTGEDEKVTVFNAPLGSFGARTLAAFALGIISETVYKDCKLIGKIRNKFAHEVHISFEDPKYLGGAMN